MSIKREKFGVMPDGREISLYTIENRNGLSASFTDMGAVWVRMMVPDQEGHPDDVLLGYDNGECYLTNGPHFGAVVGRIANRTAGGSFLLGGRVFFLGKNNGENNLHSGPDYFDRRLWSAEADETVDSVTFSLESPDGDQGFPGNAKISVTYTLTDGDTVEILYRVVCDKDTPVNMTNHAYFNLAGHGSGPVLSHKVQIDADFFTPSAADSIPTGEILRVDDTPMDFKELKEIGRDIGADYVQLNQAGGYDHNWCLNHARGVYALSAYVMERQSGRVMEVYTDMPGMQFYTANFLNGVKGKDGAVYEKRGAFCFETQFYPDSVNKPQFASPVLPAGQEFVSKTGYRFSIGK